MLKNLVIALVILFSLGSCFKGKSGFECNYNACSYKAPASEIAAVQSYLTANNINAVEHCSGLFYVIDAPGDGNSPTPCHSVYVSYTGRLADGTVFDSNTGIGLSLPNTIAGWTNGIPLLKMGGQIRLFIPPSLGYGAQGIPPTIPPNSILIFDVKLLGF
jgi:FKBP-type peptidyl-prolyl cis-trans isomerase FkpA